MKTFLGLSMLALLAGCHSAVRSDDFRWSVKAPSQVSLGSKSKLRFVAEARTPDGGLVADVPYLWVVEWVGLHGTRHQGYSTHEEQITVKGSPGTAQLRILALDGDREVEVARASFEVVTEQLPAK